MQKPKHDIEDDWRLVLAKTGAPKEPGQSPGRRGGPGGSGGSRPTPQAMRASLMRATARKPQVMLKITRYSKTTEGVKAHLEYITRAGKYAHKGDGPLPLHDQDGGDVEGLEAIMEAGENLASGIPGLAAEGARPRSGRQRERTAMHMMLSMPPGTDPARFELGVRDFLRERFSAHEYLFAFHNDTDHYHAHVVIGMQGHDGRWLNPKKHDLAEWREDFAAALERNGIAAMASRAYARGRPPQHRPARIEQMDKRDQRDGTRSRRRPDVSPTHDQEAEDRAIEARAGAWRRLGDHYADQGDAEAAAAIRAHIAEHFGPTPEAEARPDPAAELRAAIAARDPAAAAAVLRPLPVDQAREVAAEAGLRMKGDQAGGSKTGAKKGEDRDR